MIFDIKGENIPWSIYLCCFPDRDTCYDKPVLLYLSGLALFPFVTFRCCLNFAECVCQKRRSNLIRLNRVVTHLQPTNQYSFFYIFTSKNWWLSLAFFAVTKLSYVFYNVSSFWGYLNLFKRMRLLPKIFEPIKGIDAFPGVTV